MAKLYDLITPKAYAELLHRNTAGRIIPVDGTFYFKETEGFSGKKEFMQVERIPNAVYFDTNEFEDKESPYSHMCPDLDTFNAGMRKLGIKEDDILVVYDRNSNFCAARTAWVLGTLGHRSVFLLTGFNQYKKEGYPVDKSRVTSTSPYGTSDYTSKLSKKDEQVIPFEQLYRMVKSGEVRSLNFFDSRPLERFLGEIEDPRPGIKTGHVPGCKPLPYSELLEDGNIPGDVVQIKAKLDACLAKHGVHFEHGRPIIVMCGSGITACLAKTVIEMAGYGQAKLYDGSWFEWSHRSDPKYISRGKDW